ncbi:hypothetical protein [Polaromonas sp.]|uniref:hypothetical protein n=1 Tax=Polaromonas sp. TaxID=1869339 RepID=UPI00286A4DB5|nr:hypothetical protein [Polaromonas sp.]
MLVARHSQEHSGDALRFAQAHQAGGAWFAAQPWPHLVGWLARFEASALYQSVMQKHLPWQAGAG